MESYKSDVGYGVHSHVGPTGSHPSKLKIEGF